MEKQQHQTDCKQKQRDKLIVTDAQVGGYQKTNKPQSYYFGRFSRSFLVQSVVEP